MQRFLALAMSLLAALALSSTACLNVKAPEKIEIGNDSRVVDARHVPATHDHEECRQKLNDAYGEIQHLQAKVDRLEQDKRELKKERDDYKDRYKKLKKSGGD